MNEADFLQWVLRDYFLLENESQDLFMTDEELGDFINHSKPKRYPCVAYLSHSIKYPTISQMKFIYEEQLYQWIDKFSATPKTLNLHGGR